MLKDAPVVILDEATAYTDPENEAVVQAGVARLVSGKTLIVIAHRLSTITDADTIFVINEGKLANFLQRHYYDSVAVDTLKVIGEMEFFKYRLVDAGVADSAAKGAE